MTPEERVRASFARQGLLATLGAQVVRVAPGEVDVELAFDERLTQQHGYVHAGALTRPSTALAATPH
jgi:acyl-coenzyme A thioesterase PaaI-like protein